jgi:hypothetical protein
MIEKNRKSKFGSYGHFLKITNGMKWITNGTNGTTNGTNGCKKQLMIEKYLKNV